MRRVFYLYGFLANVAAAGLVSAQSLEDNARPTILPSISVIGVTPNRLEAVPGSSFVVSSDVLAETQPFSIKDAMRTVPGVHVVDEDAFGLNLNIGIRGLDPRRTSRTLLLEDGMPIHLGPYSDPTSHYHTPLYRLDRIEVVKGSGQIVHGPQTVGGVINFVTTPIPRAFAATVNGAIGNRSYTNIDASFGSGGDRGGFLFQASRKEGDGVRANNKHQVSDFALKGQLDLTERQSLMIKGGYYQERSNFGEAGIDQARFEADPRSYPFANDRFNLERWIAQGVYTYRFSENVKFSTNLYYQHLERASYRQLDAIAEDGDNETLRRRAGPSGSPNIAGCPADVDFTTPGGFELYAPVCGNAMRPRRYEFFGIEPRLDARHTLLGVTSETVVGARLHSENIRRQRYNGASATARETSPGSFLRDAFHIDTNAFSAYGQNTFYVGDLTVTPGVRLESYRQTNRASAFNFSPADAAISDRKTKVLPGLGATYYGLSQTTVFAGVHRGFAPPRPDANLDPSIILEGDDFAPVDPEVSTNYELGFRSTPAKGIQIEATVFRIDFKNQIVPGQALGLPQTYVNGGRSRNQGLELAGRADFGVMAGRTDNLYATLSYTGLNKASFRGDLFDDGANLRGNRLPYAPRHLLSVGFGYEHPVGLEVRGGMTYVSAQYSDAANSVTPSADGQSGRIAPQTIFNAAASYRLRPGVSLFINANNLFDRTLIVSRVNGIHVNQPRQVIAGLRWSL